MINNDIRYVKGVGEKRALLLKKLEITDKYKLLSYYPVRYEDRTNIVPIYKLHYADPNAKYTVRAKVLDHSHFFWKNRQVLKIILSDNTGVLTIPCFNRNYLKDVFKVGDEFFISGKVSGYYKGEISMSDFEYEKIEKSDEQEQIHTGRLVPIYRLTEGIEQKFLRKIIFAELNKAINSFGEPLPQRLIDKYRLPSFSKSLYQIHFPADAKSAESARKRLAFDKLFMLELHLARKKISVAANLKNYNYKKFDLKEKFIQSLKFSLTAAQKRALEEILNDLKHAEPMNRLLQGDVGCGKTVVALISMLLAVENNYQAALMVPTEILAEQHYNNLKKYLEGFNIDVVLLVGKQKKSARAEILKKIKEGSAQIIIGTHAVIQENVEFAGLSYLIIDEQHRFGVIQRASLRKKGLNPDVLVMTATPIPRTLALTVYGDLDISIIDEMPPGRKTVKTLWFFQKKRDEIYKFIKEQIDKGLQIFVVYPLVEESEKVDLKDAISMYDEFRQKIFKNYKVALIHGRMKPVEKNEVMNCFKNRKVDILVSTTVIEVGVDVPDASTIVIEHAERFGLAQLHQLRGRIGRSDIQSYCILLTGYKLSEEARQRMNVMVNCADGFTLAEEDLKLRGPGEFTGIRQSGFPDLSPADIIKDVKILSAARNEAFEIIAQDPELKSKEYHLLKNELKKEIYFSD